MADNPMKDYEIIRIDNETIKRKDNGELYSVSSGGDLKTINGQTITGSGNIELQVPITTRSNEMLFDSSVTNRLQFASQFVDKVDGKQDKLTAEILNSFLVAGDNCKIEIVDGKIRISFIPPTYRNY